MRATYDSESDAIQIHLAGEGVRAVHSEDVPPGVLVDEDADGNAIGVEVLDTTVNLDGLSEAGERFGIDAVALRRVAEAAVATPDQMASLQTRRRSSCARLSWPVLPDPVSPAGR